MFKMLTTDHSTCIQTILRKSAASRPIMHAAASGVAKGAKGPSPPNPPDKT